MNRISLRMKMFIFSFILVFFSVVTSGAIMIRNISGAFEKELGSRAIAIGRTFAQLPDIKLHVGKEGGASIIQPIAERVRLSTDVDYIVVFDMNRIRYSNPSESKLGTAFEGGDEQASLSEHEYVSKAQGVVGFAIRAFVPVMDEDGVKQIGVVSVGILSPTLQSLLDDYKNDILFSLMSGLLIGLIGSLFIANHLKKQTFNMEPYEIARLVKERSAMMQSMDIGILATDENERIIYLNRIAQEYTGLKNEVLSIEEAFPDSWLTKEALRTSEEVSYRPMLLNDTMVLVRIFPIIVGEQRAGSLIMMTNQKEAQSLAEELTGIKSLVDSLRSQNHEYMNKLHSIAGMIQLDRSQEALNLIIDETSDEQEVMQFLKERIADYSTLGLLIGKRSRAKELGVLFTIDDESFLSEVMTGFSSGDLVTILGNLIDNAMEACLLEEDKEINILIEGNRDFLFIEIEDTGCGLPLQAEKMFDYGFSMKEKEGRGIGLALVKQIMDANKGEINARSQSGAGSIITLKAGERLYD